MLSVTIRTKPITRFIKIRKESKLIHVPFIYVSGKQFKISVYVKNHGKTDFQGGTIKIYVRYTFGQFQETIKGKIGTIKPDKEVKVELEDYTWGVLANGYVLFIAEIKDDYFNSIPLCDKKAKKALEPWKELGYQVHSIHALALAEFFTLTALLVSILVFLSNTILTVILNLEKLSKYWTDNWNALQAYQRGLIIFAVIVCVGLWLVFVYGYYDYYGLHAKNKS